MKKRYLLVAFYLLCFFGINAQTIVINEVITSNSEVLTDEDGSYEDWIELYNAGTTAVNLNGYGLSDTSDPYQWIFPEKIVQPGEYLLIWCSDKNKTNPDAPLHANFKISSGGEVITLTDNNGQQADSFPAIVIPQNYSYGRKPDGTSQFAIFPEPTPGTSNLTPGYSEILEAPGFSIASGFYANAQSLALTAAVGTTILYTLDGSEPDENNLLGTTYQYKNQYPKNPGDSFGTLFSKNFITKTYTGPVNLQNRSSQPNKISNISTTFDSDAYYLPDFPVAKGTVVRAKAIKAGAMPSKTITQTYFISDEGEDWFSLPVASLSFDEDKLFDYNNGIHVAGIDFDNWRTAYPNGNSNYAPANYERDGDEWEIKGNFSFFDEGQEVVNQDIGMVIHGGFTKRFPNKSLRLYARAEYGKSTFDYPFFAGNDFDSFKRLILRNSGNDYNTTYFLDGFIQKSVKHLNFQTQSYRPAVAFINGEYWGMLNLMERYDKHYFKRVFGIDEDELDYMEIAGVIEAKEGDLNHYNNLISYVENNPLSEEANYAFVKTQLDPINYADYFITEIYINNMDWPANNMEMFRKRTASYEPDAPNGQDGRWRWILKDTDASFGLTGPYTYNSLAAATATNGPSHPNPAWSTLLFRKMLESTEFKNYFINRFADLLNTTFLPERMQTIYDGMKADITGSIGDHIDRWSAIGSVQIWNDYCSAIISYAHLRPPAQREHIKEKFDIDSTITATLNVTDEAEGFIRINTIDINPSTPGIDENPYPWAGAYFHNIPVTIKAVAMPGYQFSHWYGDVTGTQQEITYVPTADFSVTAHFEPAEIIPVEQPIYFWMMDGDVANDTPLTLLDASFEASGEASLVFVSCLEGYPFDSSHASWRKASMERRNSPTEINYIAEANDGLTFAESNMKGLQIKQPFQNNGMENTMLFNVPTVGYRDIVFGFATKDEGAADGLLIDYSLDGGESWSIAGLPQSEFGLTADYQLFEAHFDDIPAADNNENLKVRIRFSGDALTEDNGNRVTFNNFSVHGISLVSGLDDKLKDKIAIYPNPVSDILTIGGEQGTFQYTIFSLDGKMVKSGSSENNQINVSALQKGLYLLQLTSEGRSSMVKIVKL